MVKRSISFKVVERRAIYLGIAALLLVLSLSFVFIKGFNLGIDFESGLSISVKVDDEDVGIEDVRRSLSRLEGVRVQNIGSSDDGRYQIRVKLPDGSDQRSMENVINECLSSRFASYSILESSFIGAKFSSSLITGSVKAVAIALALILVYVWIRFKVAYAISSILALVHDVVLMLGFISITGFEISSTTIAAILTIIGYSLNNTIVIFDRIRESIRGDFDQKTSVSRPSPSRKSQPARRGSPRSTDPASAASESACVICAIAPKTGFTVKSSGRTTPQSFRPPSSW